MGENQVKEVDNDVSVDNDDEEEEGVEDNDKGTAHCLVLIAHCWSVLRGEERFCCNDGETSLPLDKVFSLHALFKWSQNHVILF